MLPDFQYATETKPFSLRFVWKKRKFSIVDLKALINDIEKFFSLNFIYSSAESILHHQNFKIPSIKQICILLPDFLYATETKPFSLRFVWKKRKISIVDLKALINDIEKFFSLNFIYSSAESILHRQNIKITSIKKICILLPDFSRCRAKRSHENNSLSVSWRTQCGYFHSKLSVSHLRSYGAYNCT